MAHKPPSAAIDDDYSLPSREAEVDEDREPDPRGERTLLMIVNPTTNAIVAVFSKVPDLKLLLRRYEGLTNGSLEAYDISGQLLQF